MRAAVFHTPFMPPTRSAKEVFTWAVDRATVADQAGCSEFWIGEHATQSWESIPNPELVIAAAALNTENITLAPGAHLLPYHNPASLAIQIAWLTQILEGRYILGVGAGAYPADGALRGLDDLSANHKMVVESIEIMQKIWAGEPFKHEGTYFTAGFPQEDPSHPFRNMLPHDGKVRMGLTGLSQNSPSIRFAGAHGYLPLSVYAGNTFLKTHWSVYSEAAEQNGHKADRDDHHVVRDVFVADTDAEAKKLAKEGGMGKAWAEYLLPVYKQFGIADGLAEGTGVDAADIDLDFLAEHVWICGSPDTVVEKFQAFQEASGGFGTIMTYDYDYLDDPAPFNESTRLLAQEVAPRVKLPAAVG
ncbi:LLM class flavin-dependent oxidoreductase [Pseudonocardia endophytica]|uniref:Alkanesulfonate monooxygenase SsuD/methylene tetrahydromethanopterin reductase-like flavin-dependent oxidoreductase (Luciferase family) n=1 Tax=Pseudonocardia endophytica TaxID=401976 RepID=A0A4R1HLQ9_PSEEN|nr:LLM class flavin-dependent oxidoreductase [Pseudonocardia endophytica]TCK22041.1 alkanesulfonate monooxygenase SsuD/methylene tetrahydromethanopterin reductase-like flavin-dependent oxidoreductase (luciferase family) [Pseudonocardia endophytica]